jgi:hypothetical protein
LSWSSYAPSGIGAVAGIIIRNGKSPAGRDSVISRVWSSTALRPLIESAFPSEKSSNPSITE